MSGRDRVSHMAWDGVPAESCDIVRCNERPILFAELAALDPNGKRLPYEAEAYLCAKHLDQLIEQARTVLVANGAVEPATTLERNVLATIKEHLP